jgi:hypothetical protein
MIRGRVGVPGFCGFAGTPNAKFAGLHNPQPMSQSRGCNRLGQKLLWPVQHPHLQQRFHFVPVAGVIDYPSQSLAWHSGAGWEP